MSNERRDTGAPEADRTHDGTGNTHPPHGSESALGNVEPDATGMSPPVEHGSRTIAGADGPIEIVEESGAAAGDIAH